MKSIARKLMCYLTKESIPVLYVGLMSLCSVNSTSLSGSDSYANCQKPQFLTYVSL